MCVWERKTQDFHSLLLVEAYLVPPKRLQMEELYKVESSFSEKKGPRFWKAAAWNAGLPRGDSHLGQGQYEKPRDILHLTMDEGHEN